MSLRTAAKYKFGPTKVKIIPLNADLSTPLPLVDKDTNLTALIATGGVGPFDFSGAANTAAVPLSVKLDDDAVITHTIDVATGSGSVSESAVTATELAAAIEAANGAAGFAGVTASVASSGRVQIAVDTVGTYKYIQVYGAAALLGEFGQGYGLQFIYLDTQQSFSIAPTNQDSETISVTDSNGKVTEIITDSYRKGFTGTLVDTAMDLSLRAVLEGGTIDSDASFYTPPNSESTKAYFAVEMAQGIYLRGTNKENDLVGYLLNRFYTCVASVGDEANDRNFQVQNYAITGTEYKSPAGTIYSDSSQEYFTVAEFATFAWDDI